MLHVKKSASLTILKQLNHIKKIDFYFLCSELRPFSLFRNIIGTEVAVFPSKAVASLQEISIYMYQNICSYTSNTCYLAIFFTLKCLRTVNTIRKTTTESWLKLKTCF